MPGGHRSEPGDAVTEAWRLCGPRLWPGARVAAVIRPTRVPAANTAAQPEAFCFSEEFPSCAS